MNAVVFLCVQPGRKLTPRILQIVSSVFVSQEHAKTASEFIDSPGPCAYGCKGGLGSQSDSRKKTNESFGMGARSRDGE